jgi:hypothetical protein
MAMLWPDYEALAESGELGHYRDCLLKPMLEHTGIKPCQQEGA